MKYQIKKYLSSFAWGGAALLFAGCSTVVRENIVTSIDTGIGASIAENKQTQMYELKAGYIHSQFYSIPTGKIVSNEKGATNDIRSNNANITPQVVSGIHAKTSLADILLGMEVSENFAVGSIAVMSPAASAMYVADAKTPTNAVSAAAAVQSVAMANSTNIFTIAIEKESIAAYQQYKALPTDADRAQWDAVIAIVTSRMNMKDLVANETPQDWDVVIRALKNRGLLK